MSRPRIVVVAGLVPGGADSLGPAERVPPGLDRKPSDTADRALRERGREEPSGKD
ncbi:hypothetical protein [Streptomyces sp. NPDC060194]|uniref:hypothetical protein n=1 Tax=Streptomyces sp. NPDC060194 TaxID=3347069 RepID=UPI0036612B4C